MTLNPDIISRQAIVIIQGMVDQRPNATIRGFVRCLADQIKRKTGTEPKVYEKPDRESGTFETRSKTILKDDTVGRPTTHIYEFYWAQNMQDTTFTQVIRWLARLLIRTPRNVPRRLLKVYTAFWTVVALTIALGIAYLLCPTLRTLYGKLAGLSWLAALLGGLWGLAQSAIINSLGDAARYMSDDPGNIEERQAIRTQGIDLLRHLHTAKDDSGNQLYDRIIMVSHSLGTVVAYDLLRLLWVEYSETYDNSIPEFPNTVLDKMEAPNYKVDTHYPQDQYDCWKMQRRAGNQWLVTDLITMGSPLAYTDYLIVGSKKEFDLRKDELEYPTCPPLFDDEYKLHWPMRRPEAKGTIDLLSYSSLFACIRWTNLFFSTDFIGGNLKPMLGEGITDIEIKQKVLFSALPYPFGHTQYWNDRQSKYSAFDQIANALQLNCNPPQKKA